MNGLNPKSIREQNILAVMQALRHLGQASRSSLAAATGLDRSTLTHISAALIDAGVMELRRRAPSSARGGRRAELLGIGSATHAVVGCDIGPSGLRWVIANLDGTAVSTGALGPSMPTSSQSARTAWLGALLEDARSSVTAALAGANERTVVGYGVTLPGLLDPDRRRIIESFELRLADVDLDEVWNAGEVPVLFGNDALCYTRRAMSRAGSEPDGLYAYTKLHRDGDAFRPSGMGVGVTVVNGGQILEGATGAAGELRGYRWQPGTLDQLGLALEQTRASSGCNAAVRAATTELVRNLLVIASVLDPPRIVLAGDICADPALAAPVLEEMADPLATRVVVRAPEQLELAEGAAVMVIEALFTNSGPGSRISFTSLLS